MNTRILLPACVAGCLVAACHKTPAPPPSGTPAVQTAPPENPTPAPDIGPVPDHVDIGIEVQDPDQWLTVKKVRGDAPGAWATADFDPARNKFTIDTHDVAEFAIDTSRVPVRWDLLVIIRIDGINTELARRDYSVYRFALDDRGAWRVAEP